MLISSHASCDAVHNDTYFMLCHGLSALFLRMIFICFNDLPKILRLVFFPVRCRKDFNLMKTGETGGLHPCSDLLNRDATFTHQPAIQQHIRSGYFPVTNMECHEVT